MIEQHFALQGEYIELDKLLKLLAIASSGGAAKAMVAGGEVRVDGEVELRKTRKLRPGARVETGEYRILIQAGEGGNGDREA